jgi:hypothetical protein
VQYTVFCMISFCIVFLYNQYNGCSQETNISVCRSLDGCYIRLWIPLNFCTMFCGLMRLYVQEALYRIRTACMYGQLRILMLFVSPHSSADIVLMFRLQL